MDEKFKKKLKEFIRYLYEKELEEITTTGSADGYSTPFAFADTDEPGRRKKKKGSKKKYKRRIGWQRYEKNKINC